jgi:hypothetical protein
MMKRTGVVDLPLHYGKAPRWLFERMRKLTKAITDVIIYEYSQEEFLKRLSDPCWFQAFSCVLGYDWHSSGTTTVTCGALKEALDPEEFGIVACGGKGKTSRKTPQEIEKNSELFSLSTKKTENLIYSSKITAKVDNSCVQDNYQLYHHSFFFTEKGDWVVIQQGMNENFARRYHWLSRKVKSFINEPHSGICGDKKERYVLNMTSEKSEETRKASVDLINDNPEHLRKFLNSSQRSLHDKYEKFSMPSHHPIFYKIDLNENDLRILKRAYEIQPKNYEELIALRGIGPKRIRALALISELIYGAKPSWKDPVKFSFAHGGKDGYPYFTNRRLMDKSTRMLEDAIEQAELGKKEKLYAIRRLHEFINK